MKNKTGFIICLMLSLACPTFSRGQQFTNRFDAAEYLDLFMLSNTTYKDSVRAGITAGSAKKYLLVYTSPETGMKNKWDIWLREDGAGVITLRGTVPHPVSWMENFYAAMVPATGSLKLNDTTVFNYQLAADPKAAVHAGWTVGLAHMAPGMMEWITKLMKEKQVSSWLIFGHSQGGALAFLATSFLYYRSQNGAFPGAINLKTYCSAAPKPGNMYYAYDFEYITRNGYGYTVVNTADWVPETPPSVQTFNDINPTNPFYNAETLLGKQKWPANWYLKSVYKKLKKAPGKTMNLYRKYFGHKIYGQVKKSLPGLQEPEYKASSNYMRAGTSVILVPDSAYRRIFPEDPQKVFMHHLFEPYRYLIRKQYPDQAIGDNRQ
jgi:hypothetical protein